MGSGDNRFTNRRTGGQAQRRSSVGAGATASRAKRDGAAANARKPAARSSQGLPRRSSAPISAAGAKKPATRAKASAVSRASQPLGAHASSRSSSHARPSTAREGSRRSARSSTRTQQGRSSSPQEKGASSKRPAWRDFLTRLASSKAAIITLVAVIIVLGVATWDGVSNFGRAYGNITVNGMSVSGLNESEMKDALRATFAPQVAQAKVTVYANEDALQKGRRSLEELEAAAIADQQSYEDSIASTDWWEVDALSLKATLPYDDVIREVLAIGRDDGGFLKRFNLMFSPQDVEMGVRFGAEALDSFASEIDKALGDERQDATVYVQGDTAQPIEGHSGLMVDRTWLSDMLSDAMIKTTSPDSFAVEVSEAESRISMEQAQEMSDSLNRLLKTSAVFSYHGTSWKVDGAKLGNWTFVSTVPDGDGFKLEPRIESSVAVPAVIKGTGAVVSAEGTRVSYSKTGSGIAVHTSGAGEIPEVSRAVENLDETLYGPDGLIGSDTVPEMLSIEIGVSEIPDETPFDQAVDMGLITAIGAYTTDFSNAEGTENRNHNIKLAADILNDCIIESNGGIWDFNTESGDTNEDAGFWSAGSIVNGEYEDSIGGGICQVATTIFNAVYEAGLDVVERHNHTLYIAGYPTGRDASVSYPDLNFTWKNNLTSDILMKLSYTDSSITAELYSVYTGYYAETEVGDWEEGEKYSTRFQVDDSLSEGAYYKKTIGEDGSKISVTRTVYNSDGKTLRTDLFQSLYQPKDEVYVIGPGTDTSSFISNSSSNGGGLGFAA